ncbi:hypothetical protein FF011L_38720 [Roseimaritima multifibrata]|uniref:Uncharacterized protein n=1 Tax=Roseimaritima multifibrata TaxID=1930274 RepID=A0A517MJP4_9BACT|nr:hypothetical protein FF011L_38720 [Roseimaritima multifibrata]
MVTSGVLALIFVLVLRAQPGTRTRIGDPLADPVSGHWPFDMERRSLAEVLSDAQSHACDLMVPHTIRSSIASQ